TTVAAFLTLLDTGEVARGAAALNQQTAFGADVISRMAAALRGPDTARRLSMLALSSIVQAIDALKLSRRVQGRIAKATIVGNCAMHHLLVGYPGETLAELPFQPYRLDSLVEDGNEEMRRLFGDTFPAGAQVALPPLIGGFVGSDALACLAYYGFDRATAPMLAIDLGTNGEVMVTDGAPNGGRDGGRILVASTAAGPAFEGVNISCGSRAVDGAIIGVEADQENGDFALTTIGDRPPVGLTGSGLLDLVCEMRRAGVIEASGRFVKEHPTFGQRLDVDEHGVRRLLITDQGIDLSELSAAEEAGEEPGRVPLYLTQHDVRELQKAKGAIRAAADILLDRLGLKPGDLERVILTGSFGSQLSVEAVVGLGMIPPVDLSVVEPSANGAGFGAALFLDDEEFARGERIAAAAEQVDLDMDPDFNQRYVQSLDLPGRQPGGQGS
ncbi:MAG: ASKHA domain-containing protein, partial [Anaerolineae bacterium]